jgi:hypothetical protein
MRSAVRKGTGRREVPIGPDGPLFPVPLPWSEDVLGPLSSRWFGHLPVRCGRCPNSLVVTRVGLGVDNPGAERRHPPGSVLVATVLPRARRDTGRWWTPKVDVHGPVDLSAAIEGDDAVWLLLDPARQTAAAPITVDLRCPQGHWRPVRLDRLYRAILDAALARRRELVTFDDL